MFRRALTLSVISCCTIALWSILLPQRAWSIDIGTKQAQRYTTQLRDAESAALASPDQTFQWATNGGALTIAEPTQPHILTLRTMQRSEQPPTTVTYTAAALHITEPARPGLRTIQLLLPATERLRVTCTPAARADAALQDLCIALRAASTQRTNTAIDLRAGLQLAVLSLLIGTIAALSCTALAGALTAVFVVGSLVAAFPAAVSVSWGGLCGILVLWVIGLAGIRRWVTTPWLRIALIAVCAGIAVKGSGVLSPGYLGTDIGFHVHKYEAILRGHIYQIADGQGLTYPYPPTVYLILALFAVPLQSVAPLELVIHLAAVVFDAATVIALAWVAQRHGWSPRRIALVAALYVVLPAGFLLQWQATVAQTIGQWLGVLAVVTTLSDAGGYRWLAMALAMVGHFGAFLSLHLTYTLALTVRSLRRQAVQWWLVFVGVSVVYFSQYASVILAQLGHLTNDDATSTIAQRWWQYAWGYGLAGHYAGVFVALCVLGLALSRPTQLRALGWLMLATTGLLLAAQVGFDIDVTRYVIYLFPMVALFGAVPLSALTRTRAGRVLVGALLAGVAFQSIAAWFLGVTSGVRLGFLW